MSQPRSEHIHVAESTSYGAILAKNSVAFRERQRNARYPIHVWPNELPTGGTPSRNVRVVERVGQWLRNSETPKLLQYTSPGVLIPPEAAEWAARNFRNIETQFVGDGLHFIQEDNPEAIGRGIADWYRRLETNEHDRNNNLVERNKP